MDEPTLLADRPGPMPPATSSRRPSLAKRALAILKYLPAVLCGLLAVAWGMSLVARVSTYSHFFGVTEVGSAGFVLYSGTIRASYYPDDEECPTFCIEEYVGGSWAGEASFICQKRDILFPRSTVIDCPIPFLLTILIPLSVGCVNRFRFPLWSWFAWTALFAVELAYYVGNDCLLLTRTAFGFLGDSFWPHALQLLLALVITAVCAGLLLLVEIGASRIIGARND